MCSQPESNICVILALIVMIAIAGWIVRMEVSTSTSAVIMENGFTVTAYTSAIPEIEYADGVVLTVKLVDPNTKNVIN